MVNLSALELIKRFISANRIKPMKKWSDRLNNSRSHYSYLSSLISSTRSLLELLSGNDTVQMLKSKVFHNNHFMFGGFVKNGGLILYV